MQVSVLNIVRRGGGSSFLLFPRVCSSFCVLSASPLPRSVCPLEALSHCGVFLFLLPPPAPRSFSAKFAPFPSLPFLSPSLPSTHSRKRRRSRRGEILPQILLPLSLPLLGAEAHLGNALAGAPLNKMEGGEKYCLSLPLPLFLIMRGVW